VAVGSHGEKVNRIFVVALACAVVGNATPLASQRVAQPERPTVATHAGTVAPGYFEIETGVERDRLNRLNSIATPTVLKFGLAPHVQLSVFGSVQSPAESATGLGDAGLGVKWRLLDDAPVLGDFAVFPSVKFPTGSLRNGDGTGTTDVGLLVISSHQVGAVAIDLNVGYVHRSGGGANTPTSATVWTASFGGPVGKFGWVGELYGYPATSGPAGQSSIVALLAGPTYTARPWLVFDLGGIFPMAGSQPNALYAGLTYNVGRLW
jgi:hypothetical protein